MLPELSGLIEVQEIDREIQAVQRELDQLPEDLKATEAALAGLQAERAAHLQKLEELKAQRLRGLFADGGVEVRVQVARDQSPPCQYI